MRKWFGILLGIMTAMGGFLDAGTIVTAGEAGARFSFGLIWVVLLATIAVILLIEMIGRFTAISQKTYAEAIRENFGFRFYLVILCSEIIASTLLLSAEIGGVAIALSLLTGISWHWLYPLSALLIWLIGWRASFSFIENAPSLLGLTMLSFIAGIIHLGGPPPELFPTLWRPHIPEGDFAEYLYLAAASFGATISPYLLYFYSSGAREERWTRHSLTLNRVTAIIGMSFGCTGTLALIILGAMTLKPLHLSSGTMGELGLTIAKAFGPWGAILYAATLFATCLSAALEVNLAVSYNIAQGFGWEWGENKKPVKVARFKLALMSILLTAFIIGSVGIDPQQLALIGSTVIALLLPISLSPFLILMNNREYLKNYTNGLALNIVIIIILAVAWVIAVSSLPLIILSGGG